MKIFMVLVIFWEIESSVGVQHVRDFQERIDDFVQPVIITVNDFLVIERAQQYLLAYLGFIIDPDCKPVLLSVLRKLAEIEPNVLWDIHFINCT
jgi:hypothetical protein